VWTFLACAWIGALAGGSCAAQAQAQTADAPPTNAAAFAQFNGRLVSEIIIEGLERQPEQLVRNELRTKVGRPFSAETVEGDLLNLYRRGLFSLVTVEVQPRADASVAVIYQVEEAPIIRDVALTGNTRIVDQELFDAANLRIGVPVDEFQLSRARRAIEDLYRQRGYYLADVSIDEEELEESGVVLFRIREGERVRVTSIRFEGAEAFEPGELRPEIRTKVRGLLEKGPLDYDTIDDDVNALVDFYQNRGYLDVRADRRVTLSPDGREAIVTFVIDEGPLYTLRDVRIERAGGGEEPLVFSDEQARGLMSVKPGDVYALLEVRRSVSAIRDAYRRLGYIDARVGSSELRDVERPRVDLLLTVAEGERFRTGEVIIQGNDITKQNVIRREIKIEPDRPLDRVALEDSRRRLIASRLFRQPSPAEPSPGVEVTIQPEDPSMPGYRDVLIEVEESNTGSINFGAAVSSDANLTGSISLRQRNFDLFDTPDSFEEFLSGRAFRGGGQEFELLAAPGVDVQTYSISLREPAIFDSNYSLLSSAFLRERDFDEFDEQRFGGRFRLGRNFGDIWTGGLTLRLESVDIRDIEASAPTDLFEAGNEDRILGIGGLLVRTTVPPPERVFPTEGARTEISVEQVLGDFQFNKITASHEVWIPVYEDFLGRRTVFSIRTEGQWIPQEDEAPFYERYFLGGNSFRGFDFRGVSPRGIRNDTGEPSDDPIGGEWAFFAGAQVLFPLFGNQDGRPIVSGVVFLDSGTVVEDIGFDDYRVSAGFGLRLLLPISPAPLAFDFGFPIAEEDFDEDRLLTFSIDLPF